MRRVVLAIVVSGLVFYPVTIFAQENKPAETVGELYFECKQSVRFASRERLTDAQLADALSCLAYLQGAAAVMVLNCAFKQRGYSPSENLTIGGYPSGIALAQSIINFAEERPDLWGDNKMTALFRLSQDFSCDN